MEDDKFASVTAEALKKYDAGEFVDSSDGSSTEDDSEDDDGTEEKPKDCGGVLKITRKKGVGWERPMDLSRVWVTIDGEEKEWVIDEDVPDWIEKGLRAMRYGEESTLKKGDLSVRIVTSCVLEVMIIPRRGNKILRFFFFGKHFYFFLIFGFSDFRIFQ